MAKIHSVIGYVVSQETSPGVWEEVEIEKTCYGEVIKSNRSLQQSGGVNDNINLSNRISIISTPYAINNIYAMRYFVFHGIKWKIINAEVEYPRIILSLGGVYNA